MITVAQARKIILSMPDSVESSHHGHPDFRVKNKIFATLWPDQAVSVVRLSIPEQTLLFESAPETFLKNGWSKMGYTGVNLKRINAAHFRRLVEESYRDTVERTKGPKRKK